MSTRTDTVNRILLGLVGLLLLAAGVLGLALSLGAFGAARSTSPVLPQGVRGFVDDNPWFWWAAAALALVIAILSVLWLIAQLRTNRISQVDCTTDARDGYTTLQAGALTKAVEDDIRGFSGVTNAAARMYDQPRRRIALIVGITDTADLDRLRTQLENQTVPHTRQAIADPTLPMDIELRPDVRRTPARTVV